MQFVILILLVNTLSYGQQVPNQTPPSPEAFKFTQYGEIPVNESSGNANVDIPLYTFKAGRINIPISVSYGGGAVKIDETNTWTGINWQLNAGGIITRTVNDIADETVPTENRIFHSSEDLHSYTVNQSPELQILTAPTVDSEVDIFNYSFLGYSGSFYLDENLEPRLIKYDKEIKIELSQNPIVNGITTFNKRTIIITTSNGTKYYFGGINASEATRIRTRAMDFTRQAQTAFHLFKIENIFGDMASFEYKVVGNTSLIGYSERFTVDTYVSVCPSETPQATIHAPGRQPAHLESSGKLLLLAITSNINNSRVYFDTSLQSNNTVQHVLNNIFIYDYKDVLYKKIVFDYITPNTINTLYKRFYLEKLSIFEGSNTTTDNIHSFEYNSPELLPDRFSEAQDYAGYYNGKIFNNTYLPKTNNAFFAAYQSGWADKSVNYNTTLYGSLDKVTYPTKGYTKFEYETGIDNTQIAYELENRFLNVYHTSTTNHIYDVSNSFSTEWTDDIPITVLNPTQSINVTIYIDVTGAITQGNIIKFTLHDLTSNNYVFKTFPLTAEAPEQHHVVPFTFPASTLNSSGRYEFILEYIKNSGVSPISLNATAQVTFSNNNQKLYYKPGIRIKYIKNYTKLGDIPLVTRYYYNKVAKLNNPIDSQYQIRIPNFDGDSMVKSCCLANSTNMLGEYTIYQKYIQSETQNNMYLSTSNRSIYEYVTVSYGGDGFVNGGKETQYYVQADIPLNPLTFVEGNYASLKKETNSSLKNGTVLRETYFPSNPAFNPTTGEINNKIKEVVNTYLDVPNKNHKITNCLVSLVYPIACPLLINMPYYTENYYFGYYYTYSWWHTLDKTITTDYLSNGAIQSSTEYFYDSNLAGLPSRIIKTGTGTDTFETKNTYPTDVLSESLMMNLKNQYRIEEPVYVMSYKNNNLLTTQKTVYEFDDSSLSSSLVLPTSLQTLKEGNGLNLEDRIIFHRYDNKGNPLEISSGGIHTVYIWGYNKTQLVTKIENATYSNIPPNLITNIEDASSSTGNEPSLISALNALRTAISLANAMVTTYTYLPLIGVSTITDPKGYTIYYNYDAFGRLEKVKVKNTQGNFDTLSENKYNYKP